MTNTDTATEWMRLVLYPYLVSNRGDIRRITNHTQGRPLKTTLVRGTLSRGYMRVTLYGPTHYVRYYVHVIVAMAFLGPPPPGCTIVNHRDGNKLNNHVSNLEWVTPSENTKHAHDTGLQTRRLGEKNHRAKLTGGNAYAIGLLRAAHMSSNEVARLFSSHGIPISGSAVRDIWRGKNWSHITGFENA